jgi:hypothetical protein
MFRFVGSAVFFEKGDSSYDRLQPRPMEVRSVKIALNRAFDKSGAATQQVRHINPLWRQNMKRAEC